MPQIRGDAYYAFQQRVEVCLDRHIPLVLGGDMFDNKTPSSFDVTFLSQTLEQMFAAGLPVYAIQGQHDQQDPPWTTTATLQKVMYVNRKVFTPVSGLVCFGLDAMKVREAAASVAEIPPECNCVLMHQLCKQVFDKDGCWDFDAATLPPQIRLALVGDYHLETDMDISREDAPALKLVYPGSAHVCSIAEAWDKHVTVVHSDSGKIQVERIPLLRRRYVKYVVRDAAELDQTIDTLRHTNFDHGAILKPAIVYVQFPAGLPDAENRLRDAVGDRAVIWPEVYGSVAALESREEEPPQRGVRLEECLARFVLPGSDIFEFTRDILQTMAPSQVFDLWRKKIGLLQ